MSRSYRLRVRETLKRVIRASDHVSSQLELLEILPPEQMSALLGQELANQGFKLQEGTATREKQGISITVELATGTVTVAAESKQKLELETEKQRTVYDDGPKSAAKTKLREDARQSLEKEAEQQRVDLQKQVTDRLEGELADVKQELDKAVNRATAAALKVKAAQMGQIKAVTEDPNSGSLTIVVEV